MLRGVYPECNEWAQHDNVLLRHGSKENCMTTNTTRFAVAAGVADIRRYPDPAAELVTQALMNAPATAGEVAAGWTHVTLADYEGWIRTNQLRKPINKAYGTVDKSRGTSLQLTAVINKPYSA